MMLQGKRKSATLFLAAAVLLFSYLTGTIDCYRLKKTERREGRQGVEAATTTGVREGKIVFGRVFEKGSGLSSQDGTKKSNSSGEDDAAYQADSTGFHQSHTHPNSKEAMAWSRMASHLTCDADRLRFRVMGPGASQFAVEQAHAPPMPLSQVPSTCGYNMQRNSLALLMLVPFDGCNMVQEGGNYVLPMRWQGIPVSLWCPKPGAPGQTTASPHPTTVTPNQPAMPLYPPMFPPFPMFPYFPPFPATTAAPTTTTSTSMTTKPATTAPPPKFPFPVFPPFYPPFPSFTTAKPQQPFPFMPMFPFPPSYPLPLFPPMPYAPPYVAEPEMTTQTTTPTTTTTATTTTAKTDPPLPNYYPPGPGFPFPFPYPYRLLYGLPPV